jgi:uncharacterized protein YjbI with pentapeptide repeats
MRVLPVYRLGGRRQASWRTALQAALFFAATWQAQAADCSSAPEPGIDWSSCNRRNLAISEANLERANLQEADLSSTDLRSSILTGANLEKARLVRASLAGASADQTIFDRVEGYRTNFSGSSARSASFQSAELQRADFTKASLTGANFQKAELGRAKFTGAVLGDNRFAFANIARANFSQAEIGGPLDFTGAYLYLTRIEGTDLSSATGLDQSQINLACGDGSTKLPRGLSAPTTWPCPAE